MIDKAILNAQGQSVEQRIDSVSFGRVYVVCGEDELFAQAFVKEEQESSVKIQKLIIPEDVEGLRG